jgi:cysteinyl-tRNA synthetase
MSIVASDDLAPKLNLGPDQVEQIQTIAQQVRDARRQLFTSMRPDVASFQNPDGTFNRQAMRDAMNTPQAKARREQITKDQEKFQDQTDQQITKVLTKTQLSNFKKMLGAAVRPGEARSAEQRQRRHRRHPRQ